MNYKPVVTPKRLVVCYECKADAFAIDAVPQYVLRVTSDGTFVYRLAWLCWFCAYPIDAPLSVHACLVPLISTISEIPEDRDRGKEQLETT